MTNIETDFYNANEAFEYFYKTISEHGTDFADTKALFDALVSAISNDSIRKDLISKGLVRCKNFSWTDAANKTIDIMQRVFGSL